MKEGPEFKIIGNIDESEQKRSATFSVQNYTIIERQCR